MGWYRVWAGAGCSGLPHIVWYYRRISTNFGILISTDDLPVISPVKMEDFKAEAGRRGSAEAGCVQGAAGKSFFFCEIILAFAMKKWYSINV